MTKYFSSLFDPEVISLLNKGAVGVIPTDTVYGLVATAKSEHAINLLYSIKSRERQPGTIIGASLDQLEDLGFLKESLVLASRYWPNAVSVVMSSANIASYLSTGLSSLPARIPNKPNLINLLEQTGPLMTTSANAPKEPTSTTVKMAQNYFGDTIDFYVDGGDLSNRPPSTIIGINHDNSITVYRQGVVSINQD